jgi:hypothetical protein
MDSFGVSFELEPEVAQELRRRRKSRPPPEELSSSQKEEETEDGDEAPPTEDATHPGLPTVEREDSDSPADIADDDESSACSLTPPPTLPLVLVDVQRLVGYQPSTDEEAQLVQSQVRTALWGDAAAAAEDSTDSMVAAGFDQRVADLFENRVGRHMDSGQARLEGILGENDQIRPASQLPEKWAHWAVVEYPEYLCWKEGSSDTSTNSAAATSSSPSPDGETPVVSTLRLWKSLFRSIHIIPVDQLLSHVRDCSRPLGWKAAMAQQIRQLARQEAALRQERRQVRDLRRWRTVQRPRELEKLYTARETLLHEVEMSKGRLRKLQEELDRVVAQRLREERLRTGQAVGLEGLDFSSTNSVLLPDEPLVLMGESDNMWDALNAGDPTDEDDYPQDDWISEEEDAGSDDPPDELGDDKHEDVGDHAQTQHTLDGDISNKEGIHPTRQGAKARRKAASRTRRNRLQAAAEEAEYKSKLETAKAEEATMREVCTTGELLTAMAMVQSLEERLERTDGLLEKMQDEEWAEEEEHILETGAIDDFEGDVEGRTKREMTLLDQILAMVLSAVFPSSGGDVREHAMWIQAEHESIVIDWKSYFGRLPSGASFSSQGVGFESSKYVVEPPTLDLKQLAPPPLDGPSKEKLKESLGIVDNNAENWDEWVDWTDSEDERKDDRRRDKVRRIPAATEKAGLRPGSRVL